MQFNIKTTFPEVQRRLDAQRKEIADRALSTAINRTADIARTAMSRAIRDEYALDAATVRERLVIRRASFRSGSLGFSASLIGSSKRPSLNVIRFQAKENTKGVAVRIKRVGGRKTITGAFIANKGRTVFVRVPDTKMPSRSQYRGKHAEKIRPVQTIELPQMFRTISVSDKVMRVINERFPVVLERELRFALSRAK